MAANHPESDLEVLGDLYHRYLTGLLLALALRAGTARASEVVFHSFRRQQMEKFLPGLAKLKLDKLPHAVACAQYHYLSNALGGAKVEWIPESDRKSWVRYLPPRWIFDGTAVCGIPNEMSQAMLRGWHANNGVLLGNLRLGFVCTSLTTDGGPGAVGYYIEEDRELAPEERLRFAPGEHPPGPAGVLPQVAWGASQRARVKRNYSMEYVRSMLTAMFQVLDARRAGDIGRMAARQVGMQFHDIVCEGLGHEVRSSDPVASFARLFARLAAAHGDDCRIEAATGGEYRLQQATWRFARGLQLPEEGFDAWNGLWEGLAALHGYPLPLQLHATRRLDRGDEVFEWRVAPTPLPHPTL